MRDTVRHDDLHEMLRGEGLDVCAHGTQLR